VCPPLEDVSILTPMGMNQFGRIVSHVQSIMEWNIVEF
jgi:hypothetical protein